MRLDISTHYAFEIFLSGQSIDSVLDYIVELTRGKLKVDDKIQDVSLCSHERMHLNVATVHDGVHCHTKQIYHDLNEEVLFDRDVLVSSWVDLTTHFDAKLLTVVLANLKHFFQTASDVHHFQLWLLEVVISYVVDVLEISDTVPGTSHCI